ncbi:MAG TPA: EAL domain-containing protein [Acidobacteriaceae bacterium]
MRDLPVEACGVLEQLPCFALIRQEDNFIYVNAATRAACGLGRGQTVLADTILLGTPGQNNAQPIDAEHPSSAEALPNSFDCILLTEDGQPRNVTGISSPILFDGKPASLVIAIERKTGLYDDLRGHGTFLEELLDSAPEALAIIHRRRVLHVNHEFTRLFGYTMQEALGKNLDDLVVPPGREKEPSSLMDSVGRNQRSYLETVRRTKSGDLVDVSVLMAPVRIAGDDVGHFVSYRDIRMQKKVEAELQHSALHDSLTGLANRVLFHERLQLVIQEKRSPESNFAIMFLDLDQFKQVNDTQGHANGDTLLLKITERLQMCLRPHDIVARFGGDEFAILLDRVQAPGDTVRVANRIQSAVCEPIDLGGIEVLVSASIGIVLGSPEYVSAEQIMRDADFAMYRAKANGKARHEIFDNTMMARHTVQKELETQLRDAVEQGQFEVWYQPVYRIASGDIDSFEALLRWRHPTRGLVPVGEFLKMAEETGMILPMGTLSLEEACRQMKRWNRKFPKVQTSISVNISPRQFSQPNLPDIVAEVLRDVDLPAQSLRLEITESSITLDPVAAEKHLQRLNDMGVRVALDNFGAGLASMTNLLRLPFGLLKLDRRLTSVLPARGTQGALIETIFGLGKSLHIRMQADGVETMPQLQELERFGCELAQGYLFSPALTAEQAEAALVRTQWTLPA